MSLTLTDLTGGGSTARRELPNALVRAADSDKRTVTGVGVPYGEELVTPWFRERFEPGACDEDAEALAYWRHSAPIGVLSSARDTDAGREVTLRLSQTATADEALTLARPSLEDVYLDLVGDQGRAEAAGTESGDVADGVTDGGAAVAGSAGAHAKGAS